MSQDMPRVVIGMDPHKRTATIEVMTADEIIVGGGQFTTDTDGYTAMRDYGRQWPETGPGGHRGTTLKSSAAGSHPHTSTSEKPLPGPATPSLRPALPAAS